MSFAQVDGVCLRDTAGKRVHAANSGRPLQTLRLSRFRGPTFKLHNHHSNNR